MSRGAHALLDLPAETVAVVRDIGLRIAPLAIGGLISAFPFMLGAAFSYEVGRDLGTPTWRSIGSEFALAHTVAWLGASAFLAAAWTMASYVPLLRLTRAVPPVSDLSFPVIALLLFPSIAVGALLIPPEDPSRQATVVWLLGLAVAVAVVFDSSTTFTLAPAVYVADRSLGVMGALRRSRELARGRRALYAAVSLLPVLLGAVGVVALVFGEKLTLGTEIFGSQIARGLVHGVGLVCIAIAPVLSAALKGAALSIATRPD